MGVVELLGELRNHRMRRRTYEKCREEEAAALADARDMLAVDELPTLDASFCIVLDVDAIAIGVSEMS